MASGSALPAPRSLLPAPGSGLVLPGDRAPETAAFEAAMVDFFVDAAELLGVPKSVAAIYGIVFASPVPLSFADIESRLDISKGSVSQGLRVLREVGALKATSMEQGAASTELEADLPVPSGGNLAPSSRLQAPSSERQSSRGVLYEPDLEMRKLVARFLENRLEKQLTSGSSRLAMLTKNVPGKNGEAAELRRRLKSLQDWHSKAKALLPLAKTFLKLGG